MAGVGAKDQVLPSQDSTSTPLPELPTAVHDRVEAQDTAANEASPKALAVELSHPRTAPEVTGAVHNARVVAKTQGTAKVDSVPRLPELSMPEPNIAPPNGIDAVNASPRGPPQCHR
ncbi:MAG TPA: hypothetical protein VME20_09315 [Acidimicrobiales bacterium]|nr:hypothetical protein [Acidimicrobiales bacterium]